MGHDGIMSRQYSVKYRGVILYVVPSLTNLSSHGLFFIILVPYQATVDFQN